MGAKIMRKVLIVDDALSMRVAIKNILIKYDYEIVAEAYDGRTALDMYKEFKPDIVTLDVTMPEMTGLQALKAIVEFDPDAKVVMVSTWKQDLKIIEAIMCGAKSFVLKPFREDHVIETLNTIC